MHAIVQEELGPAEVLVPRVLPDLEPGPGSVRVAVEAAGVHLLDAALREGRGGGPAPVPALPATPGREIAGRVDRLGPGVPADWDGAPVVAHLGPGARAGTRARHSSRWTASTAGPPASTRRRPSR